MTKPTRTAEQLQQLVLERINQIPGVHGEQNDVYKGGVIWMPGGDGFPNWTVRVVSTRDPHRADIARAIRSLQEQFDLED